MLLVLAVKKVKILLRLLPLTVRLAAPGPTMLMLLDTEISPVISRIIPLVRNLIQSPDWESATACRKEPGPESCKSVT